MRNYHEKFIRGINTTIDSVPSDTTKIHYHHLQNSLGSILVLAEVNHKPEGVGIHTEPSIY